MISRTPPLPLRATPHSHASAYGPRDARTLVSTSKAFLGCRMYPQDAADYSAIGKHVVVVIVPLAGWTTRRGAFEKQRHHPSIISARAPKEQPTMKNTKEAQNRKPASSSQTASHITLASAPALSLFMLVKNPTACFELWSVNSTSVSCLCCAKYSPPARCVSAKKAPTCAAITSNRPTKNNIAAVISCTFTRVTSVWNKATAAGIATKPPPFK